MPEKEEYVLYRYTPSIAAAAVVISVFAILTGLHTYRMIRTKLWFCVPFTIGGACTYRYSIDHGLSSSLTSNVPCSRTHWIHWPRCRSQQPRVPRPFHHTVAVRPGGSGALRSKHLHDARPSHPRGPRRIPVGRPGVLAHQTFRVRRCLYVLHPRRRWRDHGIPRPGQSEVG